MAFVAAGLKTSDVIPELGKSVGEELLAPTRIYVRAVKEVLRHYPVKRGVIRGLAHITGGGLIDNIERILPQGRRAMLSRGSWPILPVFTWLKKLGNIPQAEMDHVFNNGIGFAAIVAPFYADSIREQLVNEGIPTYVIGSVEKGERGVSLE